MASAKVPPVKVVRSVERARQYLTRIHQRTAPPQAAMFDLILGAWVAQAITAAADLGVADALAKGPLPIDELAGRVDANPDALARLLRALISKGVFRQRRDGRYELNALAGTLRTDAPVSARGMARLVGSKEHREHWSHLTQAMRTGRSVIEGLLGMPPWEYLAAEPELAELFNTAMTSVSELAIGPVIAAYDFSPYATIVDVGGGHGRLLAAILDATPAASGVLYDLDVVVAGAPPLLDEYRVTQRVRLVPGSFFDTVPEGGDAYVLKNVIHDWSDEESVRILRNVRAAAEAGKTLLLVEWVIPEGDGEFIGKFTDLEMLLGNDGRERTADEYRRLLDQAGFAMTRIVPTVSPFSLVEAKAA